MDYLPLVAPVTLFTDNERREFIDEHVAHRLTALLSIIRRQSDPSFYSGRGDVYCASIEGAFIMLRVFVEFLGVESQHDGPRQACPTQPRQDERPETRIITLRSMLAGVKRHR